MSLSTTNTFDSYIGNGLVTTFAFTFQVYEDSQIQVTIDKIEVTNFTITRNSDQQNNPGGSITFTAAPIIGVEVVIARVVPLTQPTKYGTASPFAAEVTELQMDELVMMIQQVSAQAGGGSEGDFLPLAGGTMAPNATVQWQAVGLPAIGQQVFSNVLGLATFQWAPSPGSDPIGYLWTAGNGVSVGLNPDGEFAITGRKAFADLPDNAIAIKSDITTGGGQFVPLGGGTWDEGALMVYPQPTGAPDSSAAEMGFINFFGINALRIRAVTPNTPLGIGYLLLTDDQNIDAPYVVASKSSGWRVRFQNFTDPDAIITRQYLEDEYVEEAPIDGVAYFRQDGNWVDSAGAGTFLPLAGGQMDQNAIIQMRATVPSEILGNFSFTNLFGIGSFYWNAPGAGTNIGYLMQTTQAAGGPSFGGNSTTGWEIENQVNNSDDSILTRGLGNSLYLADAPADGNEYVRQNNAWVQNTGGSGGEVNTASNLGAGIGVFAQKAAVDLQFKSFIAGTNITITQTATEITINASGTVGVAWGAITGTLSDQTDLQNALNAKVNLVGDQTLDGQITVDGGTTGGLVVVGTGAGFSIDATGIILGRAGFNANNQKLVALLAGTANTDAVNVGQLNSGLAGKANVSHTHTIAQVTGLQAALDGKAAISHGHAIADVSGLQTALNAKTDRAANENINGIWTFASGFSASVGVALNGGALCGGSRLQGVGAPIVGTDAATRAWVEANFVAQ